ncbi:hypothetical protein F0562_030054 [Nyssa sinensis]|uniref:Protein kinase domain-containing protein n=1 Tax=Nyssa sinensis TaxID=561372 RepID=A0A5J5B1Q6_9ASTE|nr:hypothetical protein F0562_030054 [Nyssa sinensis]
MKDPSLSRRRKPNQSKKLKLVCSFNGTFQPRPPSGKLKYTGGESRIVSVDRNIGFSRLKSKISELLCPKNNVSFSLKYQLPDSESIDEDNPLVLITCDDDVRCMIEEYEKLESYGKPTRLWIFVCKDNANVNGHSVKNNISVNCIETEKLYNGFEVLCENNGFGGDRKGTCVTSVSDSLCRNVSESGSDFGGDKVKNSAASVAGVRCSDSSLRKMVLKHQLLVKQSSQTQSLHSGRGLAVEQTVMAFTKEDQKYGRSLVDYNPEPEGPGSYETTAPNLGGDLDRLNILDYKFMNTHSPGGENFGNLVPLLVSHCHPWNPRDRYPLVDMSSSMKCLSERSGLILGNRAGTSCGGSSQFVEASQFRNQSCNVNMNLMPVGSDANCELRSIEPAPLSNLHWENMMTCVRMDGRPWVRKFYPGLRSSSNISKQGQAMRSYYPTFLRPSSGYPDHTPEGIERAMKSGLDKQTYLLGHPYGNKENLKEKGSPGVPRHGNLAYDGACTGMSNQSLLPLNITENPLTCRRATDTQEDLLTGSKVEKHEIPYQAPCKCSHGDRLIYYDINKETCQMDPQEAISFSGFSNNLCYNGTEIGCNGKLSASNSFGNHHNIAHTIQGGIASSVDLSLCKLSLSSSKEVEPPAHSSPTGNDVFEALFKPQSKPLDLMDEESLGSGPQVEKSNGVASNSSSQNAVELEKDNEQKQEIRQDPPSSLDIDEKADFKGSHKCSKENGGIPSELVAFYTHLATRELQTIKNSDLEYIKELGSGTYGTVFYGKWKGSDVAIKRLKPSCFTEGAVEEDRLVADFWKEAHILGQLHHPNIVAFYGVVTDGPVTNLATVTEYMVNGSLKQVLRKKDRTIDRRKRLIIAMDAAFGMEYLHEKNIVHFDLKSHNFLVNMRDPQRPVCKIGDLGLSKIKQRTLVSGGVRGTIPWMAPELLNTKNMVTEKVDVYSFGVVMWELLTGEEPYANMRSEEIIAGIIKGNLRPEIPSWCDPAWRSLMERCWSSDPDSRPAFSEIAKELRAMSAAMNIK